MKRWSEPSNQDKRFYVFLLEEEFSYDDHYSPTMYAIEDRFDPDNPIRFLEFFSKKKCEEVVDWLNREHEEKMYWKASYGSYLSAWSILSNEVGILQETGDVDRFIEKYYKYIRMRSEYEGS